MHKDIMREVVGALAMCGLVLSSILATAGVASLGVEAQVAFAQIMPGDSGTAAVALAASSTTGLSDAQIQAVVGLLASFNVDPATINNVDAILHNHMSSNGSAPQPGTASSTTTRSRFSTFNGVRTLITNQNLNNPSSLVSSCPGIRGTLQLGMNGADVSLLQNFLASQGYMASSSATAFFGPTTEGALQQWQAAAGIVSSGDASSTGWGVFGPRTQALAKLCNPSVQPPAWTPPSGTQYPGYRSDGTSGYASSSPSIGAPYVGVPLGTKDTGFEGKPGATSSSVTTEVPAPTCALTSTQASSSPNTVKITWTSTNAIYASNPNGGKDPANGSRTLTVNETTIFKKTVYGMGGSGTCYVTVSVGNAGGPTPASTTPPTTPPTVQALAPTSADINLASVASAAAQLPFSIAINSLTDIFVQLGVGQ